MEIPTGDFVDALLNGTPDIAGRASLP